MRIKEIKSEMDFAVEQAPLPYKPSDNYCPNCEQLLLKPGKVDCGHSVCWYCFKSLKSNMKVFICPKCSVVSENAELVGEKEKEAIDYVLNSEQ